MHVEPDPVRDPVFGEDALAVLPHDPVDVAGEEAELHQPLRLNARRGRPDARVWSPGFDLSHRGLLSGEPVFEDGRLVVADDLRQL